MVDSSRQAGASSGQIEITEEMEAVGRRALLRLVAEDDIHNDPNWIVREIWAAMRAVASRGVHSPTG
jgi:hypothetical protein